MARRRSRKRSGVSKPDEADEVKPEIAEEESVSVAAEALEPEVSAGFPGDDESMSTLQVTAQSAQVVRSLWPGRLVVRGTPSGREYLWPEAGSAVVVEAEDLEFLAEKNRKLRACCGSSGERRYFAFE